MSGNAVLGATDSNLNLSFLRIKKLDGKKLHPVDFSAAAQIAVGLELAGMDRLGKGFDYARQPERGGAEKGRGGRQGGG